MYIGGLVSFITHAKRMIRLILMTLSLINLLLFINVFNLQYFFFLQAMSFGREPSPMKLFGEKHVRS